MTEREVKDGEMETIQKTPTIFLLRLLEGSVEQYTISTFVSYNTVMQCEDKL